jgi:DNA-binding XRE family transcriptional regulator
MAESKAESKIGKLAIEAGYKNPQALSYDARITRATIYNIWRGDIINMRLGTAIKIANVLNCNIEDLYTENEVINAG